MGSTTRDVVRWVRARSLTVDRAVYMVLLAQRMRNPQPIIVFTMGKVGSTAMMDAIGASTARPVLHCHRMTKDGIRSVPHQRERWRLGGLAPSWRGTYGRWMTRSGAWKIVTAVRDPIGRMISGYFQVGRAFGYLNPDGSLRAEAPPIEEFLAERIDARDWFDEELLAITGLDVYETPFPTERGYDILRNERFEVLVLRFEDLRTVGPLALQTFLGTDRPVALATRNSASSKRYRDTYQAVLTYLDLPTTLLERFYTTKQARHFYSPEELRSFRERWMAGSRTRGD